MVVGRGINQQIVGRWFSVNAVFKSFSCSR